jgi:GNAT superfamily N-acetyltransferase
MLDPASIPAPLRQTTEALAARIEDASLSVSQPAQQSFFDGWILRYSPGKAKRARSINSIGAGVLPLAEKLSQCADFYQRHRLPCLFRITPFSQPHNLDTELAAAHFGAHQDTRVMAVALSKVVPSAPQSAAQTVNVERFAMAFCALHGLDPIKASAERERYARTADRGIFAIQLDGDMVVACGSLAMEGKLAGIFGMVTAAEYRGRGVATAIVAKLLDGARAAGAETAYLQVEADNAPARRTYLKFGFRDCYAYWYRAPVGSNDNL